MNPDIKRAASLLLIGGIVGGLAGWAIDSLLHRDEADGSEISAYSHRVSSDDYPRSQVMVPERYDKPSLDETYREMQRTNYSTIVDESGYSAPETVDTSSLDTGLHIPSNRDELMETFQNESISKADTDGDEWMPFLETKELLDDILPIDKDDEDVDEYEGLTDEEAKALRRSQIRGSIETEEEEKVEAIIPLHDNEHGTWQRISWDKFVNDIPFYLKRTATYFMPNDVLAGYDDDILPIDKDDEIYRRCWTLIHEDGLDDTGLYFIDPDENIAIEVVVMKNENFLDSVAEMKQNRA